MSAEIAPLDLTAFNYANPLVGLDDIRAVNPQRYEFEMLSGIVHVDPTTQRRTPKASAHFYSRVIRTAGAALDEEAPAGPARAG